MGTRHLSLLEQKKMQWAKEREEMAGLCTPWGPAERVRPLRKRLAPNLPEDPNEDYQSRDDDGSAISVVPPLKEIHSNNQVLSVPSDSRGRTPRGRSDPDSNSSSLPPVNQNIHAEDPRRISFYQRDGMPEKHEGYDNYIYLNDSSGLSKSTENFSTSESDPRVKRKPFLSGDRAPELGSYDKISADRSPYSSSYQFVNSNLSLATDGDATWREWGMGRGNVDEIRPRWGDRGINTGHPWNSGGPTPIARMCDNPGHPEEYPTPGWVERGLSRMSGDGRGRGSAESPRNDPGIRVVISDETGGVQRMRGSLSELQNVAYVPVGRSSNENFPQRNYDGYSSALPYVGEMPTIHSSAGMHQRHGGSVIEGGRGERMIVVGRDVCNASDIVHSGRPYGYNGCISAPNNKPLSQKFKKTDDVTASLPNLQMPNTHLRGQNVPVDPEVVVEREMRRLKAMELQKAIRQQLEEREKIRLQEKELRIKEEREIEERLRQQQEAERMKKEEEERKHREKEEMENKKAEIMREALEAAEQDAQKQRKKRTVHKMEEKVQEADLSKGQNDYPGIIDTNEHINNYNVSSCCPVITEDTPNAVLEPPEGLLDDISSALPINMKLEGGMAPGGRVTTDYREMPYHSTTTPVAPFKITIPEPSMLGGHCDVGGDSSDPRQGGVLIVGRDVYLLPYVNTDVLAPRHLGGSAYTVGPGVGIESIGNGILGSPDHCDFRRDWITSTQRVRPSKDVGTQTEPSTQGPLLLLLRMAGPDDSQTGSEPRSSTDDSSIPENEFKDGKGKAFNEDLGTASVDCCFCQKTSSQSQPTCSKGPSQDCQQKQPQQLDQRPKWGANRPTRRYTTQSEKDPHYSCRNTSQKRQSVGRSKKEVPDTLTAEDGSEDPEQAVKPQVRAKSKAETSTTNAPSSSASTRHPTTKKKGQSSKKKSEKSSETGESSQQTGQHVSQSSLPVLVPPRTIAPKRVQVVKPSLSLDQELIGQTEYQTLESPANRAHLSYFPPPQFTPMQMFPDCKHLPPPVLSPLQKSCYSPTRFTQIPLAPIRLSPSPTPPTRICPTPMPNNRPPNSPMPSSRHTQTPRTISPTPTQQLPLQSNRHCGSPPVPAVLSKMRREQAKSPPRQFSFISTAPDRERPSHPPPPPQTRKESRSGTPLLKPQTPSAKVPSPRVENKSTVVVVTPSEEPARKSPVLKPLRPMTLPVMENNGLLTTPTDEISMRSPSNISCPSRSSAQDNSNALMMVTSTEDISVGSPVPNPLINSLSMVEVDENGSIVLVTPSDEISVGLDSRSNNSLSRASQLSAEGIPEGFWEDLGSSARMSSSQAEASTAASLPEDGKDEQKVKEKGSVGSTEQDDKKAKQTGSNKLESNALSKSPDTFSVHHKPESHAEEENNGKKELGEGVKEAKKFNSLTPTVGDEHTLGPGVSCNNEETPRQTPKEETGDKVRQRTESEACSTSPRAVKDELKQKSHDSIGGTLNQGPEEVKPSQVPLREKKPMSPNIREEGKRGPKQDGLNSKPLTIPSADETISVIDKNEDITDSVNVDIEPELIIQDEAHGGFSEETETMTELERNYSTTEEKMEGNDVNKPGEEKMKGNDNTKPGEEKMKGDVITKPGEEKMKVTDAARPEEEIMKGNDVTRPEEEVITGSDVATPEEEKMKGDDATKPEEKKHTPRNAKDEKETDASLRKSDSSGEGECKEDKNLDKIKNNGHDEEDQNSSIGKELSPEGHKEKK